MQAELSRQQEELAQIFMCHGNLEAGLQMLALDDVIEAALQATEIPSLLPQVHPQQSSTAPSRTWGQPPIGGLVLRGLPPALVRALGKS